MNVLIILKSIGHSRLIPVVCHSIPSFLWNLNNLPWVLPIWDNPYVSEPIQHVGYIRIPSTSHMSGKENLHMNWRNMNSGSLDDYFKKPDVQEIFDIAVPALWILFLCTDSFSWLKAIHMCTQKTSRYTKSQVYIPKRHTLLHVLPPANAWRGCSFMLAIKGGRSKCFKKYSR